MKNFLSKVHWPAVGAAAITVLSVLGSPQILGLLPQKYTWVGIASGVALQSITKAVHSGGGSTDPVAPPAQPVS